MSSRSDWDDGVEFADDQTDMVRSFAVVGTNLPSELPPLEVIVQRGEAQARLTDAQALVYQLVDDRRSIAEISAIGGMPLGAVRVIIAQLAEAGVVNVQQSLSPQLSQDGQFLRRLRALVSNY